MSTETLRRTYDCSLDATFVAKTADHDGWEHNEWRVTLKRGEETYTLPFRMGLGHQQTRCGRRVETGGRYRIRPCEHIRCQGDLLPSPPTLYDVLTSLRADVTHGETFEQWAAGLGLDTDSRRALEMYLACQQAEAHGLRLFGDQWPVLLDDEAYS